MKEFWYVAQSGENKGTDKYSFGAVLSEPNKGEAEILEMMNNWCKENKGRLVLLIQCNRWLPIVNQIFPAALDLESTECLERVLLAIGA